MKKLIAGNWKMNGSLVKATELAEAICGRVEKDPQILEKTEILICPPFPYLAVSTAIIMGYGNHVLLGAQDCSVHDEGAYTGDVAASMLASLDCRYVILGHSERRQHFAESDQLVARKAAKAHAAGLSAIICLGEQADDRENGRAQDVVGTQLGSSLPETATAENTVIAYEPVWAIGSGNTATPEDVGAMHGFIREKLKEQVAHPEKMRILYGGSMKPENAKDLLATANVDGGLIGGASLNADQFLGIAQAA